MYAVIKTGGKQYTVKPGDVLDGSKFWWQHPMSAGLQVSAAWSARVIVSPTPRWKSPRSTAKEVNHNGT